MTRWVRFDSATAEWVSCVIDPAGRAWTVCGRAVGIDERYIFPDGGVLGYAFQIFADAGEALPDGWTVLRCSDCDDRSDS